MYRSLIMAYTYKHIRKDTNEVFYIGIGSDKHYNRAHRKSRRTKHWTNIVNKCDYEVEIIEDNLTWEQACEKEKYWIKFYGRKDLNEGNLVNMTDGGEGSINPSVELRKLWSEQKTGRILSDETKQKMGMAKRGIKQSETHIQKLSEARKGRIVSDETKQKMSISHIGKEMKPFSEEHKLRLSKSLSGRIQSEEQKRKISEANKGKKKPICECPHCGKTGGASQMKQWHFDNCKNKK
jgi:hypothetical protein